jgi:hypothetical protein
VFILLLLDPPVYRSVHFVLESAPSVLLLRHCANAVDLMRV